MAPKARVAISWSGGKDSALCLHRLRQSEEYEAVALFTTFIGDQRRVGLHFIPEPLIEAQAQALGLPLYSIYLPDNPLNEVYVKAQQNKIQEMHKTLGIAQVAFGDLFLQPIKEFRDRFMRPTAAEPLYPLWGEDTHDLLREYEQAGYRARICAVDSLKLPERVLGKDLSESLLREFSSQTDWCGENGEYHTLVYDGPTFSHPVDFHIGEEVQRIDYRPEIEMAMAYKLVEAAGQTSPA